MAQESLFDTDEFLAWREHWKEMPEYKHDDLTPWNSVIIHFDSREGMQALSRILGQTLTEKTQSIWFPKAEIGRMVDKRYRDATDPGERPATITERLPESPTRSKVYGDWANHETWLLCVYLLDQPEIREEAIARLDDEEDELIEYLDGATKEIAKRYGIDRDLVAWGEIIEEIEWVGRMF